jgi:hypothetical protein
MYPKHEKAQTALKELMESNNDQQLTRGLFIVIGGMIDQDEPSRARADDVSLASVSRTLSRDESTLWVPAAYACGLLQRSQILRLSTSVLDRLLTLWTSGMENRFAIYAAFALHIQLGRKPRHTWTPVLSQEQVSQVRHHLDVDLPKAVYTSESVSVNCSSA